MNKYLGKNNRMGFGSNRSPQGPKVGYLFPGQGAQSVGMGKQLYDNSAAARSIFEKIDVALDRPLTKLMHEGPEDELRNTRNAQPAIMGVSLACTVVMQEQLGHDGLPEPTLLAGHSLGEFTALAFAGVLDLPDAIRLVQRRGELMQKACELKPGVMAAIIGLDHMVIEEISRETGTYVSNINTEEQIVIGGDRLAVARALDLATSRGAKRAVPLRVGGAFHSALMEPAKSGLVDTVNQLDFHNPTIPIIANCTGEPLNQGDEIKREIISQISSCVQWKRSMDYMLGAGISKFVEIGPGKTLSSIMKRINRSAETVSVSDLDTIQQLRRN